MCALANHALVYVQGGDREVSSRVAGQHAQRLALQRLARQQQQKQQEQAWEDGAVGYGAAPGAASDSSLPPSPHHQHRHQSPPAPDPAAVAKWRQHFGLPAAAAAQRG